MNCLIKHYCYHLGAYTENKLRFLISYDKKLFIQHEYVCFFEKNKVIVCVILTIYLHWIILIFEKSDTKPIIFAVTSYHRCYIHKWHWEIIICFACFVTIVIWLYHYIVLIDLIYIINRLLGQNISRFFFIAAKKKSIRFFSEQKLFVWFYW